MAKPKAPVWLREAFRDGVVELMPARPIPAYRGAQGRCWLAQHDERRRPCSGPFERFHFIGRQRVEAVVWQHLLEATIPEPCELCRGSGCNPSNVLYACPGCFGERCCPRPLLYGESSDLILLAAWDPRNGGIGCEGHHRRFDSHLTPALTVPRDALPGHVIDFATDWLLESQLEHRFPQ